MTKILAVLALAVAVLGVTPTASAWGRGGFNRDSSIEIKNEDTFVKTTTLSSATSGNIDQWSMANWGGDVGQKITTGVAVADSFSGVAVGYTKLPCACGLNSKDIEIKNNDLFVTTTTNARASTGNVNQWGVASGSRSDVWEEVTTGNAGATSESQIMVGYTDFSVSMPD